MQATGSRVSGLPSWDLSVEGPYEQQLVLLRLMRGEGISGFEQLNLLEQCDHCLKYFLAVHLRPHIMSCKEDDVEDLQEEIRRYRQREISVEV